MTFPTINFLAVLVSSIAGLAIGVFWYSPKAFGNLWLKLSGITQEQIAVAKQQSMAKSYIVNFFGQLIMNLVLALFLSAAENLSQALFMGFLLWLGFIAPVLLNSVLWEKKPAKLYWLNLGHLLVVILVSSLILVVWK